MSDEQIIQALILRNEEALIWMNSKYSKLLWVVAWSVLKDQFSPSDVEELISDVFFRIWQTPEKFDANRSSLKNYLVLMTKSIALNKLRTKHFSFETDESFLLEMIPETTSNESSLWHYFFESINHLKDPTKIICYQRFFLELKPTTISKNLGLSLVEVNNRLYKGKIKIKHFMAEKMKGEENEK